MSTNIESDSTEKNEATGGAPEQKEAPKSKKKILIILAVVALIAIAGVAYFFKGASRSNVQVEGEAAHANNISGEEGKAQGASAASTIMDMEEFLLNLNVSGKTPSFLKLKVKLELKDAADKQKIEEHMAKIRDAFQIYLRELRPNEIQGSIGLYRLREELLLRINKIVAPLSINSVLFDQILVQ